MRGILALSRRAVVRVAAAWQLGTDSPSRAGLVADFEGNFLAMGFNVAQRDPMVAIRLNGYFAIANGNLLLRTGNDAMEPRIARASIVPETAGPFSDHCVRSSSTSQSGLRGLAFTAERWSRSSIGGFPCSSFATASPAGAVGPPRPRRCFESV